MGSEPGVREPVTEAQVTKGSFPNVAFLANSFHLTQTRSSQFFIDLLNQWFGEVRVIAHQDVWAELPGTRWDRIVVWQHLFTPEELEAFGSPNVILVPMYDDCPKEREFWVRYRGFKVVCFSTTLADLLEPWGLDCLRVTYRPPVPQSQVDWSRGLRGFFWPRTETLDWRHIGPLLELVDWESFHLHLGHTPAATVLPEPSALGGKMRTSRWFDGPQDFHQVLANANVFFAPRRYEGIGMAVLEALALGMCVVAPDFPTANEYIVSGETGWLFDPDRPTAIDLGQAPRFGKAARGAAEAGRRDWEQSLSRLKQFLLDAPPRPRRGWHPWIRARGIGWVLLRRLYRGMKTVLKR